ncbi:HlyD family secretion protein, partial [Synechococcus sp. AH-229-G18]|nr:HlyD family secretion protein [Synechococcus sp. AH-229-G18]
MTNSQNAQPNLQNQQNPIPDDILGDSDKSLVLKQPHYWARAISWTLMSVTVFGVGWLAIAKTDEVVSVTGKLEPLGVVKDVQVPVGGVVDEILVKDGERVTKGQILLRLDTEATLDRQSSTQQTIVFTKQQLKLKRDELDNSLEVNQTTQDVLSKRLDLEIEISKRYKQLLEQGASAELQYLTQKNKVQEIQGQLDESKIERLRQESILQQDIRGLQSQLADLQSQLTELNVNI